jgi:hypothetical protein
MTKIWTLKPTNCWQTMDMQKRGCKKFQWVDMDWSFVWNLQIEYQSLEDECWLLYKDKLK